MRRTNKQELAAGLPFGAVGAAAIVLSRADEMGSASQMGPAYFPTLLGAVLLILGVLVIIRALRSGPLPLPSFAGRPLLLVLAAIALFALCIAKAGLIVTTLAVVILSRFARAEYAWRETVLLAVALAAFCTVLFHFGLGLQLPLLPVLTRSG